MILYECQDTTQPEPVGSKNNGKHQDNKNDHENEPAATPRARATSKTEHPLQAIKEPIQQKEFEQTRQTTWTLIHCIEFSF
jgi:hypothetical protein